MTDEDKILEWCGFKYLHQSHANKAVYDSPVGNWLFESELPDLDLNFYFKYAVPKLNKGGYTLMVETVSKEGLTDVCILSPVESGGLWNGTSKNPAEAFGQALLKLIKGSKPNNSQ